MHNASVTSYKRPESVLVVIFDENRNVLVLQRQDNHNIWQSVTGSLEEDELPIQTAYREVLEEIGFDAQANSAIILDTRIVNQYAIRPEWRYKYPPNNFINTEYVFLLEIPSETPIVLTEHVSYKWLTAIVAEQLIWSESNKRAVTQFLVQS